MTDSIDRRKFLKLTGSAGLGLGLLSSYATALEKTPAAVTNAETTGYLYDNAATNAYATEPYNVEHSWNSEQLWSQSISPQVESSKV